MNPVIWKNENFRGEGKMLTAIIAIVSLASILAISTASAVLHRKAQAADAFRRGQAGELLNYSLRYSQKSLKRIRKSYLAGISATAEAHAVRGWTSRVKAYPFYEIRDKEAVRTYLTAYQRQYRLMKAESLNSVW